MFAWRKIVSLILFVAFFSAASTLKAQTDFRTDFKIRTDSHGWIKGKSETARAIVLHSARETESTWDGTIRSWAVCNETIGCTGEAYPNYDTQTTGTTMLFSRGWVIVLECQEGFSKCPVLVPGKVYSVYFKTTGHWQWKQTTAFLSLPGSGGKKIKIAYEGAASWPTVEKKFHPNSTNWFVAVSTSDAYLGQPVATIDDAVSVIESYIAQTTAKLRRKQGKRQTREPQRWPMGG